MFLLPSNMLMITILLFSTLMAISSTNWLMMWAALELNLLSFIPMMMSSKSHQEIEASTKYFLSQALGSALMVTFSIMMWSELMNNFTMNMLMMAMLIKLGAAPCHFWFPSVMSSISWMNCLILTTWQKVAPLMIILFPLLSNSLNKLMLVVAPLNAILGGLLGMNQTRMKSIMAYSSITHTGWILSATLIFMPMLSTMYFILYIIIVTPVFIILLNINSNSSPNLNKTLSSSFLNSIIISSMFMSMGGLPPLTGFFPKLMMMEFLSNYSSWIIIILIMGSLLNLFFYLNLSFNMILSSQNLQNNYSNNPNFKILSLSAISLLGLIMFIMYAMTMFNKS